MIINAQITSKTKQNLGIHVFESHEALVNFCKDEEHQYRLVDTKHRGWVITPTVVEEIRKYNLDASRRTQQPALN